MWTWQGLCVPGLRVELSLDWLASGVTGLERAPGGNSSDPWHQVHFVTGTLLCEPCQRSFVTMGRFCNDETWEVLYDRFNGCDGSELMLDGALMGGHAQRALFLLQEREPTLWSWKDDVISMMHVALAGAKVGSAPFVEHRDVVPEVTVFRMLKNYFRDIIEGGASDSDLWALVKCSILQGGGLLVLEYADLLIELDTRAFLRLLMLCVHRQPDGDNLRGLLERLAHHPDISWEYVPYASIFWNVKSGKRVPYLTHVHGWTVGDYLHRMANAKKSPEVKESLKGLLMEFSIGERWSSQHD